MALQIAIAVIVVFMAAQVVVAVPWRTKITYPYHPEIRTK
jgi:hypothetical protein